MPKIGKSGKYDYFDALKRLSTLSCSAVTLACSPFEPRSKEELSGLRRQCDALVCELEDALFSDFLPPLERDGIAACAHALSRVVDQASDLLNYVEFSPSFCRQNTEGSVCVDLAKQLREGICLLPHIRKPDELPDVQRYRKTLREGREAHLRLLERLHTGALPRSCAQAMILTARLRSELSVAFDQLVEIMLNNI